MPAMSQLWTETQARSMCTHGQGQGHRKAKSDPQREGACSVHNIVSVQASVFHCQVLAGAATSPHSISLGRQARAEPYRPAGAAIPAYDQDKKLCTLGYEPACNSCSVCSRETCSNAVHLKLICKAKWTSPTVYNSGACATHNACHMNKTSQSAVSCCVCLPIAVQTTSAGPVSLSAHELAH